MNWFTGFEGYLHVDAQNIYDELGKQKNIQLVLCNAHARRNFESIYKMVVSKDGLAREAMRFYHAIYRIENEAKNKEMNSGEIYQLRLEKTKPLFDEFYNWMKEEYPLVLPKSPLGHAFEYAIKHWKELTRFFEDGRLSLDNNHTEREIKPLVIARKNFLFATSVHGAHALSHYMSLIRTAKHHGLDSYRYLTCIFEKLPYCQTVEDYEKLLPWNIQLNNIKKEAA